MRKVFLIAALFFCISSSAAAARILTTGQNLTVDQTLVSAGGAFVLGFFSPPNSTNRYVGIWYRNYSLTVVWVANRQSPLTANSTGALMFTPNGSLVVVMNRNSRILWSTDTGGSAGGRYAAQLLDSGNLVVRREDNNISVEYLWQSFDHPTDTLLPGMKIGPDLRRGLSRSLTSWASPSDPSPGNFTLSIEPHGVPQLEINVGSECVWRAGPWNGAGFVGAVPEINVVTYSSTFHFGPDEIYYSFSTVDGVMTRVVIGNDGIDRRLIWFDPPGTWSVLWSGPKDACDRLSVCGPNGVCDMSRSPSICSCLPGFEPKQAAEWNRRNTSGGCVRMKALGCSRGGGVRDGFSEVKRVKLPDTSAASMLSEIDLDGCRERCLMNCSCTAYASGNVTARGNGCIMWMSELTDLRVFDNGGQSLYIRQSISDAAEKKSKKWIFAVVIAPVTLLILAFLFCCMKIMRGAGNSLSEQSHFKWSNELASKFEVGKETSSDFFLFQFFEIVEATENFSFANKLGEGGFGPVYKGILLDGHEIAVKRLSAHSGQGLLEFKNEILLIAKLQHRNLVRLLGCCIEGEEKMLVYEFMPNKSLDLFLFHQNQQALLDWRRRFHIIEGIAQGLLYLHKYSRLTIIHRDLKASNVLLDIDMNPKISDFGMARIFSSNELEACTTNKVVGTYGYISPEYALKGHFSTKSDVFSFGVIMLEIITGKRNSSFQQQGTSLNLLAHAWKIWKEGNLVELVDATLVGMYPLEEVSRCVHVALLCVQERSVDRPSMSDVITMLNSDNSTLCYPNQPAFFLVEIAGISHDPANSNINEVTFTAIDGR